MTLKQKIWIPLAIFHLLLVACGGFQVPLWSFGTLGHALTTYGKYSGSGSMYSFFAPNIGYSYRTQFEVYDEKSNLLTTEGLYDASTREGNLRLANIIEILSKNLNDPEKRQLLSGSLTGKVFARHPQATRIVMRVEYMDIPQMNPYHEGVRYQWEPVYKAQYSLKKRPNE